MTKKHTKFIYRVGDLIKVIAGNYKGEVGKLILLNKQSGKATINLENTTTIKDVEKKILIDVSNCMVFDELTNSINRIGFNIENGEKKRYLKKSKRIISNSKDN